MFIKKALKQKTSLSKKKRKKNEKIGRFFGKKKWSAARGQVSVGGVSLGRKKRAKKEKRGRPASGKGYITKFVGCRTPHEIWPKTGDSKQRVNRQEGGETPTHDDGGQGTGLN